MKVKIVSNGFAKLKDKKGKFASLSFGDEIIDPTAAQLKTAKDHPQLRIVEIKEPDKKDGKK